jgi:predicted acyltransferase
MVKANTRFLSLDVFRGMTVCFMIIVNTPGTGATPFAPLLHASWHGFTPTDLVFPAFLFAVGNAMSFNKQMTTSEFWTKTLKRTAWIFLLGYLMYWYPFFATNASGSLEFRPLSGTRILGVLQRIALCYFFASIMVRYLSPKTLILSSLVLLFGYWAAVLMFGDAADPYSMLGSAGHKLDVFLIGEDHLSHKEGLPFEPQGFLSTIPAIVLVIGGYLAGKFIQKSGKNYETIAKMLLVGGLLIIAALCWNNFFPINKKLWTSSYSLLTTGLSLSIIASLLYIVEIKPWNDNKWTGFFTVFGKNPLFIYLLAELLAASIHRIDVAGGENVYSYLSESVFQAIVAGPVGSLLFAIAFMLFCWMIGWILDKRGIYIKV